MSSEVLTSFDTHSASHTCEGGKHWQIGKQMGNGVVFSVIFYMEQPEDLPSTPSCPTKQLCDNMNKLVTFFVISFSICKNT